MIWFTSDTHFGHKNIEELCGRKPDWQERYLQWCESEIDKGDRVYHLGDFAVGKEWEEEVFERIPGQKFLIHGNHDDKRVERLPWCWHGPYKEITIEHTKIVMFHYPIHSWNRCRHGSYHLYGHVHGDYKNIGRSMDVGFDAVGGIPISWERVYMQLHNKETFDHHDKT